MPTTSLFRKILRLPKVPESIERAGSGFADRLFVADNDRWLSILRIGLGIQVLLYAMSAKEDWYFMLAGAEHGLIGRAFSEALLSLESPLVPRLGWLVATGARAGLSEWTVLSIVWCALILGGCGLLVGIFSRACAILAWFVHLCATNSGSLLSYGVDQFMTIGLFYLMLSPLPDRLGVDYRLAKKPRHDAEALTGSCQLPRQSVSEKRRAELLGFWRRVLQVHLCFIYFFGGLSKALGNGWWTGEGLWRALTRPPFNLIPAETLICWKYVFPIAGIAVCILELGYPFGIWPSRTRLAWLVGIVAMHIGIGLTMGMYLFALIMIILSVAAFGPGSIRQLSNNLSQNYFVSTEFENQDYHSPRGDI